ncbi:hypothetical protein IFM89_021985 [Coptis chinensis]|uniref:Uncharacterized protein n=1 Tax=Coptis chinensis TaxID=261450 RepID=A0A835LWN9_9MAGN|nr:hypothetical protein IFM89_021985 [Coptis chinensis]
MEYSDNKSESNGNMNTGHNAKTSRENSVNDISSEVYPPPIPRQGSWMQSTELRQLKNPPPLARKPIMGNQISEKLKLGNKKHPPVKKPNTNISQYLDTSVERLLGSDQR